MSSTKRERNDSAADGDDTAKKQKGGVRTVADLLVECLVAEGLKYVFGLPGEENADFVLALDRRKDDIGFILGRHEQGCAFGADVYGRLTGRPAVVLATLGPGATNTMTAVADANMDRVPLVVVTGQAGQDRVHKESHQAMDVRALFKPITKWGATITGPNTVAEIVRKAFKVAMAEKPGATHIELPENVAAMPVGDDLVPLRRAPNKLRRAVADDKALDRVYELLVASKRPVVLAGNGVLRHGANGQLLAFCEATGVPVVNTFMGKGVVPASKPYALFTVGLASGDHNNEVLTNADLVLSLGFDIVEYAPANWNRGGALRIVHLDFTAAEVDAHYQCEAEAVGDLSHSLWGLNERLRARPYRVPSTDYYERPRAAMLADFTAHDKDTGPGRVAPQLCMTEVHNVFPEATVTPDVGLNKFLVSRYYHTEYPNRVLVGNGWCSMGIAVPGAIGARLAHPDREVVAITGDGGLLMNLQEFETATRCGTKIIVVVWVDGEYGLIKFKQEKHFNGQSSRLQFGNPDFMLLAKAFGFRGERVRSPDEMRPALERAKASEDSVLIAVDVDYETASAHLKTLGHSRSQ